MDCCDPPVHLDVEPDARQHRLAVRGFVALWRDERPHLRDLDADAATVEAMRRGGRIVVDPDGRVLGIHGLSAQPTPHRIVHGGRAVHTWCAFDAVGIPAALGLDAHATTTCPTCGRELTVTFTAGEPSGAPPLRLWFPTGPCANVLDDVCAHANLYCDDQHLAAATPTRPGRPLTVAEAAAIGRLTWHDAATATGVGRRRP